MSGSRRALAAAVLAAGLLAPPAMVMAAPPTVVPSPGYDLRLQESRRARAAEPGYRRAPAEIAPRRQRAPEQWRSRPRRLY